MFWNSSLLLLLGITLCCNVLPAAAQGYSEKLVADLNIPKTKCCIPLKDKSDNITLQYGLTLIDVIDFNFENGMADFLFWEKLQWKDFRLKWDPAKYNDIMSLRVDADELWTPDMFFYSNLDTNDKRANVKAILNSDGTILHIPPNRKRIRCDIDGDMVQCNFKVGSWTYDGNTIALASYGDTTEIETNNFRVSNLFEITENKAEVRVEYYQCCPEPYPNVYFSLSMKSLKNGALGITAAPLMLAMILALYEFIL